jgi:hypothetical protein
MDFIQDIAAILKPKPITEKFQDTFDLVEETSAYL